MHHELVDHEDEWNLFQSAALAVGWGASALAPRAISEAGGEGFAELSMVVGLLTWLAWDVGIDISVELQRRTLAGLEDPRWYGVQLLASLGLWLVDDSIAQDVLEESVALTPRFRIDGERWFGIHHEALETFVFASSSPDELGKLGRSVRPGDLAILNAREAPRVRVVLEVGAGSGGETLVMFDPGAKDCVRTFLASRIPTLAWVGSVGVRARTD